MRLLFLFLPLLLAGCGTWTRQDTIGFMAGVRDGLQRQNEYSQERIDILTRPSYSYRPSQAEMAAQARQNAQLQQINQNLEALRYGY